MDKKTEVAEAKEGQEEDAEISIKAQVDQPGLAMVKAVVEVREKIDRRLS